MSNIIRYKDKNISVSNEELADMFDLIINTANAFDQEEYISDYVPDDIIAKHIHIAEHLSERVGRAKG